MKSILLCTALICSITLFSQEASEGKKALDQGLKQLNNGQFDEAITSFTKAAELDENMDVAYYFRAQANIYKQEYANAVDDATIAIQMNPENLDAYLMRAKANTSLQSIEGAEAAMEDCDYVIVQDPQHADAYFDRSKAQMVLEDYTAAASDCSKAIEIDPARADFYYGRGMIYIAYENQPDKGCGDLLKAAELGHEHAAELSAQMCQ